MASLFSTAIVAACMGAQGQYNQACNKAVDAGTRQVGFRQQVDMVEDGTVRLVNSEAEKKIGKDGMWTLGAGYFVYKTTKTKQVEFRLPNLGIAETISNQITPTSYTINFKWGF